MDDNTETLCYVCLTGSSAVGVVKSASIMIGNKFTASAIQKCITGEMIKTINKSVGFRIFTKYGTSIVINLIKMVPAIGGLAGSTFDGIMTNIVGNTDRNVFISV